MASIQTLPGNEARVRSLRSLSAKKGVDMSVKVLLDESEIPRQWYNLAADLPSPMQPPLGPDGKPVRPEMLAPVFPMNIIEQEVSRERWINIPETVLELLYLWRPSPLYRARRLE